MVLLFGCNGQLGTVLRELLLLNAEVYLSDISDQVGVNRWLVDNEPYGEVINAVAMTAVDGCETDECRAFEVNALGPKYLAENVARQGGTLLHVSTDYVFPGIDPTPRKETDPVCPINAYGRTKWAGEVFVRALCSKHFIVRTAWLYGLHGKNFVKTILKKARETGRISDGCGSIRESYVCQ